LTFKTGGHTLKNLFSLLIRFKFRVLLIEDTDDTWIQLFRSLFVGGVATVVDFLVAALVRELLGGNDVISNASGFVFGLITNYLISILWVFKKHNMNIAKEFAIFTVIGIIGLFINTGIVFVLGKMWNSDEVRIMFYVAKLIATLITLIWNFAARKIILYKN
jgi:putative flippase GtrA